MLDINIYSMINSLIGACILIIFCPFMEKLIIRGQISSSTYFFRIPVNHMQASLAI